MRAADNFYLIRSTTTAANPVRRKNLLARKQAQTGKELFVIYSEMKIISEIQRQMELVTIAKPIKRYLYHERGKHKRGKDCFLHLKLNENLS